MNNTKNTIVAVAMVAVLAIIAYSVWRVVERRVTKGDNQNQGTLCAADVLQCADGTWVGRTGPECQFVCPAGTSTPATKTEASLQGVIGQTVGDLGVTIKPTEVLEDSRCPVGVQCIQAGTVRVKAVVVSGMGTSTPVFSLDKPVTTETETITLVAVTPAPQKDAITIAAKDYRFTWKVTKR